MAQGVPLPSVTGNKGRKPGGRNLVGWKIRRMKVSPQPGRKGRAITPLYTWGN